MHSNMHSDCRFIRTEEDDVSSQPWEVALARKYYSRLFREYAVVDLSRYKVGCFNSQAQSCYAFICI